MAIVTGLFAWAFLCIWRIGARTFVPKVLVDQRSSKSRKVLHTVISLHSISSSPASNQSFSSAPIRDAAELGGRGGERPDCRIAAKSGVMRDVERGMTMGGFPAVALLYAQGYRREEFVEG